MNRKKFIESLGATCQNWNWSWSFISEKKKWIIFGAWDKNTDEDNTTLIFSKKWEYNYAKRRNLAYQESLKHIQLVESGEYSLMTFPIIYSGKKQDKKGFGPATIKRIIPDLKKRKLLKNGDEWFASENDVFISPISEEVQSFGKYVEGVLRTIKVNVYERSPKARNICISYYGAKCVACGFDFQKVYGEIGRGLIHVHHLIPISKLKKKYHIDPIKDLRPVCPNCHAIIHRNQEPLSIEKLKKIIKKPRGT